MEVSVKLIVHSHLSDSIVEMEFSPELAKTRIKFVKYLISSYRMDDAINPNVVWERYNDSLNGKVFS